MTCIQILEEVLTRAHGDTLNVAADGLGNLADCKGSYILTIHLADQTLISVPRIETSVVEPGVYLYVGSAYGSGGIAARLKRHLKRHKKIHWHVDQLTTKAATVGALIVPGGNECELVETLLASGCFKTAIKNFGSSDCRTCDSHLLMPIA